jgi:hypothetical protein
MINLSALLTGLVSLLTAIPQINALVNEAVKDVEAAFPGLAGNLKFAAAEAKVQAWLGDAVSGLGTFIDLKTELAKLINGAVAAFNAANEFTHAPTTTAAAPAK